MQPSAWGHHQILICHNPTCIYARAKARRDAPVIQPAAVRVWRDADEPGVREVPANVLCLAGGLRARRLVSLLADGAAHSPAECQRIAGNGNNLAQMVLRMRQRGFDIRCEDKRTHARYVLRAFPSCEERTSEAACATSAESL